MIVLVSQHIEVYCKEIHAIVRSIGALLDWDSKGGTILL